MELMSFTKTVADVMQEVEESAKREVEISRNQSSDAAPQALPAPTNDRAKIVITIQDKDGQKTFRVYAVSFFTACDFTYTHDRYCVLFVMFNKWHILFSFCYISS